MNFTRFFLDVASKSPAMTINTKDVEIAFRGAILAAFGVFIAHLIAGFGSWQTGILIVSGQDLTEPAVFVATYILRLVLQYINDNTK